MILKNPKGYLYAALVVAAFNLSMCMAQTNWQSNPTGEIFARQGGDSPEGIFHFSSGGFDIFTIQSSDKSFQPAALYYGENDIDKEKVDSMAPDGKVPTAMNCFLARTPEGYVMFDTGLPGAKGGKTLERLASIDVTPERISYIYLTHGHFDHIGGLLTEDNQATYPNAVVYLPEEEVTFIKESMGDTFQNISEAYKERLVFFKAGQILPCNVLPIEAKGHTPGHTAYRIGNLLFSGDIMHGASIQIPNPEICANYDMDRAQAIATREKLLSYAVANSLTLLGAHIPANGVLF